MSDTDRLKKAAANRFGLPVAQMRYWQELTRIQQEEAERHWGKEPPYICYIYAAKRDGGLVWNRWSIARLEQLGI